MSTFLMVLPAVWEQTAIACLDSCFRPKSEYGSALGLAPEEVLVVDNTRAGSIADAAGTHWPGIGVHRDPDGHNLGVAESWNVGARRVLDENLDWLVICSASMVFGPYLHTSFREQVERAYAENGWPGAQMVEATGHSWHLISIHRRTLEVVGLFDPWYWPAYEESIDWGYRQKLLGLEEVGWPRVWCNAMSIGTAVHVDRARWDAPQANGHALGEYYAEKWGGPKGFESFDTPWNLDVPLGYYKAPFTVPLAAERQGIEGWW